MKLLILCATLLFILVGCKVGPDYVTPVVMVPESYKEQQPDQSSPASDEDFYHWWEIVFNDAFLNQLLEETLQNNFDLRIAWQRIYQARANYWVQFTSILPEIDSDFQATRYRTSQSFASAGLAATPTTTTPGTKVASTSLSPVQDFFQIGLDAVWEIDLFGKLRRTAQSAYDSWEASIEDERAVKISVLSEVATIYLTICYYQTKVGLAKELVEFDETLASLSKERFDAGLTDEEELVEALAILEADRATQSSLKIILDQNIYSLAVLQGRIPESIMSDFDVNRKIPEVSGKIPDTLPSDLLRRRPDIAAAERALAAQTELIGVAVADLFPSVNLIGSSSSYAANPLQGANIGFSSDQIGKLFKSSSRVWGFGALVTLPVFDFGKRYAAVDIQKFLTNQAYLSYEQTVIAALQEVESALSTYFKEEERLAYLTKLVAYNERNLNLVTDLFESGLADYTQVLQAKEVLLNAVNSMTDSQEALGVDLVAVYKALGGNW